MNSPQALLISCGGWWLSNTAKALETRDALAGLWISGKNQPAVAAGLFRRCWPYHVAYKPFLHMRFTPQIWTEQAFYALFPLWRAWLVRQDWPQCDIVHAMVGYATEPFDHAERTGALKVVDCPNSHPTSYYGYWQRECDLWCPGERVPIPQWMFARMNRELERADLVLCPSDFVRDTMVLNGIPAEKCFVNPFGVDINIFRPRESVPAKIRFVSVGTICVRKGYQYLFRAFEIVRKKMPEAELICCGGYKCDFRKERVKWEGTFRHIEHLPHPELAKLLQTCTASVFPSQEEGFARAQIEALACGLPVIGTYEGGTTTLVKDGVEGFIVRGRNPEEIAGAMIKIATDTALNQRMGEAARRKGAVANTWQDYGDRLLAEYQRRLRS
jgi:glycosyltransferase involved in cell wall biosynthesis